ncbi:MAG: hypothetical protein ABIR94_24005, partial [Rubrivivax sp.]
MVSMCNVGACPVTATSASLSCSSFTLANNPLPAPLQPGACLNLDILFAPMVPGTYACALTITSTSPVTPTVVRQVTGVTPPAVSVHSGVVWPHGSLANAVKHGSTLNLAFIDAFAPQWAWELRFGISRFDGKGGNPANDAWHLSPNIRFTFNPGDPVLGFVNAGAGLYHFRPGGFDAGLNLGGGLRYPFDRRFAAEGTYNFHWVF